MILLTKSQCLRVDLIPMFMHEPAWRCASTGQGILATFTPSDPAHSASLIFLHGLGDDAAGLEGLCYPVHFSSLILFFKFPTFHPRIILKPFRHHKTISINQEASIYEIDLFQCTAMLCKQPGILPRHFRRSPPLTLRPTTQKIRTA